MSQFYAIILIKNLPTCLRKDTYKLSEIIQMQSDMLISKSYIKRYQYRISLTDLFICVCSLLFILSVKQISLLLTYQVLVIRLHIFYHIRHLFKKTRIMQRSILMYLRLLSIYVVILRTKICWFCIL